MSAQVYIIIIIIIIIKICRYLEWQSGDDEFRRYMEESGGDSSVNSKTIRGQRGTQIVWKWSVIWS